MSNRKSSYRFVIFAIALFFISIGASNALSQVTVTGSTGADAVYTTVGAAFTAINATAQTGNNINVAITANTTEAGPAVLNSGAWTTLTIRPTVAATIAGPTATGRGLIELNGADNVTIDGSITVGGTSRDLTIQNTAVNTITYTSVVRLAVLAATQVSADNIIIRNTNLLGSASARNAAANTSTTGSENTTFGIYAGGNGGAATPTAISSVTTNSAPSGTTINNFTATNNSFNAVARGVVFNGAAATVATTGTTITNNTVGVTPVGTTGVYTKGIWVAGTTSLTITGNTIQNIASFVATTMTGIDLVSPIGATGGTISINDNTVNNVFNQGTSGARGITQASAVVAYSIARNTISNIQVATTGTSAIAIDASSTAPSPSGIIDRNNVTNIKGIGASTFAARGISVNSGTQVTVQNNFIADVANNASGSGGFGTSFNPVGIQIAGGTNHRIYHNSVNMFGAITGSATGILGAALQVVGTGQTGLDIRNNILANTMTGGSASSVHVSINLPSSGTSAMNLTINNNDYWAGTAAGAQGIAFVGTTYSATATGTPTFAGLYTAAAFNPADTATVGNLRHYTNTLSAAGTNDNASIVTDPLYVSTTDLHLQPLSPDRNVAANVGVTADFDGQLRPGGNALFDIGADEFDGVTPPANDIGAVSIIVPANGSVSATNTTVTPQASFQNVGTATQTNVGVQFTITGPGGYNFTNAQIIPTIAPNQTVTVTFATSTAFTTAGTHNTAASVTTPDANAANDSVAGSFNVITAVNGTVSVGTGQTYTSLTNAGGIFEAINGGGQTGNIIINVVTDLTSETGTVALNQVAGGFGVTIKPSGAARTISGPTVGALGLVRFNGADNVTIDGSLSGGTDRSLTIQNTNSTAAHAVVQFVSLGAAAGATGNTVKNTILRGGTDTSASSLVTYGISSGGATPGVLGADNDNATFTNNDIAKVAIGIYSVGESTANPNQATFIAKNLIGPAAHGPDQVFIGGIVIASTNNASLLQNEIRFVGTLFAQTNTGGSTDKFGISVGRDNVTNNSTSANALTNSYISNNLIHDIVEERTFAATGIALSGGIGGGATNNIVANNFIYGVRANGTVNDTSAGIAVTSGNGDLVAYNSIYNTGDLDPVGSSTATVSSFGIQVTNSTVISNLRMLNNISYVDHTSNTGTLLHGSIFITATSVFAAGGLNNNDYYVLAANTQSIIGRIGATNYATLALYKPAAAPLETLSISGDPMFVSPTNLHVLAASPVTDAGVTVAEVPLDYDMQLRAQALVGLGNTDIGGDENLAPVSAEVSLGGRVTTADGNGIRNAILSVTGGTLSTTMYVRTGSFGYFSAPGLEAGQTYIITIHSKRYIFANPNRVISATDSVDDIDFVADPQ